MNFKFVDKILIHFGFKYSVQPRPIYITIAIKSN